MTSSSRTQILSRTSLFDSQTFDQDLRIRVGQGIGSASISPSGRDVVLASQHGLHIIDLDKPFSPPRKLRHETPWVPADVQWSPFASRYYWIASTSNQRALIWNLELSTAHAPIEHVLNGHSRAITDINFSPHHPDYLATCALGGFVHSWDLRVPARPAMIFTDWHATASQVKWSHRDTHITASSHDRVLSIWDDRKGASPVKSIDAHASKIYGIDWSRQAPNQIVTCSLDRTIKIWDYVASDTEPLSIITTALPMRRARYTPFGSGIMTMPQRGDPKLHLYDHTKASSRPSQQVIEPDCTIKGHKTLAKEFLWRIRGDHSEGFDNRDFQLVTWGSDNELILHRMRDRQLKAVGHEKGNNNPISWPTPGKHSNYTSFRDSPKPVKTVPSAISSQVDLTDPQTWPLGHSPFATGGSPGMRRALIPMTRNQVTGFLTMTYSDMQPRNGERPDNELIAWMKGVKFGKRSLSAKRKRNPTTGSEATELHHQSEALSDEIIYVADTFKRVTFEEIDISGRRVSLTLYGPWGPSRQVVFLRVAISFPANYPEHAGPDFYLERLSTLPDDTLISLEADLASIAGAHLTQQLGCLEAILFYLLGEYDLQQSTRWLLSVEPEAAQDAIKDDSSSDDEDNLGKLVSADSQYLEPDAVRAIRISNANAAVPVSNKCGARWSADGRLTCVFEPRQVPPSLLDKVPRNGNAQEGKNALYEGFGRLRADSSASKAKSNDTNDSVAGADSSPSDSVSPSSGSSSDTSHEAENFDADFYSAPAWHATNAPSRKARSKRTHSTDESIRQSLTLNRSQAAAIKSIVAIHDLSSYLPARKSLASGYRIDGDSSKICQHNATIANDNGYEHTASLWHLLHLMLDNVVPLAYTAPTQVGHEVLAVKPSLEQDLEDTELQSIMGDVKWGNHPFGYQWLVKMMFRHAEKDADVQMLAMASCVLARPSITYSKPNAQASLNAMTWPKQIQDYMPKQHIAAEPTLSLSMRHPWTRALEARSSKFPSNLRAFPAPPRTRGSRSMPASQSFEESAEPPTPFLPGHFSNDNESTDTTQPMPAPSHNASFPPNAVWSRSLEVSSSTPPVIATPDEEENMSDMDPAGDTDKDEDEETIEKDEEDEKAIVVKPTRSATFKTPGTSATPDAINLTQIPRHVPNSGPVVRRSFLAEQLAEQENQDNGDSDTESEEPGTPGDDDDEVRFTFKNQSQFDEDDSYRPPLLDPALTVQHTACRDAYASMLDAMQLLIQKQEVLKYNGALTSNGEGAALSPVQTLLIDDNGDDDAHDIAEVCMTRCCIRCGRTGVANMAKSSAKCPQCGGSLKIIACAICLEPVDALFKSCLQCGHVAHDKCLSALSKSVVAEYGASRVAHRSCGVGCGCECDGFSRLEFVDEE